MQTDKSITANRFKTHQTVRFLFIFLKFFAIKQNLQPMQFRKNGLILVFFCFTVQATICGLVFLNHAESTMNFV